MECPSDSYAIRSIIPVWGGFEPIWGYLEKQQSQPAQELQTRIKATKKLNAQHAKLEIAHVYFKLRVSALYYEIHNFRDATFLPH